MSTLEDIRERWSKWGRSRGIRSPGHLTDEHGYSRAVWFIDDNHADCINSAPKDVAFMLERIEQLEKKRDAALESLAIEIDLKKQSAEHIHSLYASSNKVFLEIVAARTKERDEARAELERLRPTDTPP